MQADLGKLGYAFQFVTLAGFHTLNHSMFQLAKGYSAQGMTAYAALQQEEIAAEKQGYTATKHQREVSLLYTLFSNPLQQKGIVQECDDANAL